MSACSKPRSIVVLKVKRERISQTLEEQSIEYVELQARIEELKNELKSHQVKENKQEEASQPTYPYNFNSDFLF